MKLNIQKPKSLFINQDICLSINNVLYNIDKNQSLQIDSNNVFFYCKLFTIKSKEYNLKDGIEYNIIIERFFNRSKLVIATILFISVIIINEFLDSDLTNLILKIYVYLFFGLTVLLNTIFSKYFFKITVEKLS
jgi:hypothetical protein